MKNLVIFSVAFLLTGCACWGNGCNKTAEQQPQAPVFTQSTAAPCVEPVILRPRVVETVVSKKKRPCCDDKPFNPADECETYVPDAPEIYVISANRTVNTMLVEAAPFFKQAGKIKVFIETENANSADLPGGMDKGTSTLNKRFSQIPTVTLTDKKDEADYIVASSADWFDTATKKVPAIKYDLFLKTPDGSVFGEWSEIIHQAQGDRSWW